MKKNNMSANLFLNRMRIPFFVCIGVLFAAEIAISAVRSQGATTAVTYINIILYLAVTLVFSVFFVVTSIRINLFLTKMRKRSSRKASLLKVTLLLNTFHLIICLMIDYYFVVMLDHRSSYFYYFVGLLFIAVFLHSTI